ncbi:MAG TPA: hypothetical protein VGE52_20375 [Pirellulales bacterium]
MAVIVDLANAVVAELNGGTFSQVFGAERGYTPVFELKDMKTLHVTVVPKGLAIEAFSRSQSQHDYQVDVAVQKKLANAGNAEVDPLMTLVEEIADFFRARRLTTYPNAIWTKTENAPVYAAEHFEDLRQFTSVLTFTFRVAR